MISEVLFSIWIDWYKKISFNVSWNGYKIVTYLKKNKETGETSINLFIRQQPTDAKPRNIQL